MMVLEFYNLMKTFLLENTELVVLCLALVQLIKMAINGKVWYQKWMGVAVAGVVSFALALPPTFDSFEVVQFLAGGFGLFGMATGVYQLFKDMMLKVAESLQKAPLP
jgi:hypothetical protein